MFVFELFSGIIKNKMSCLMNPKLSKDMYILDDKEMKNTKLGV